MTRDVADLLAGHDRAIDDGDLDAARRFATELATIARTRTSAPPPAPAALDELVVGHDASWFRWQGGAAVDLRRRRSGRLVFERLVAARLASPGIPVPATTLIAAGWPGDTIRPSSAMSRLYVVVLLLRKLGLREVILAQDGGYLLDPAIELTTARW
jgi:hypothetical protein